MAGSAGIIGGGIGGLATANYLVRHGWSVDVFERADALPEAGTALGMWPEAMVALDALGIGDRIREVGREMRTAMFKRADGSLQARVESHRGPGYLITRPPLLRALAAPLPAGIVKYATTIDDLDDLDGYDVLVGADGVNSRVRAAVAGRAVESEYLGVGALIGWADGDTGTAVETHGEGKIFGISPQEGDRTNWFAAYREHPDNPAPDNPMQYLRDNFGHWHRDVVDVVNGNIALIGDAAHAMAPAAGRGACETLIDAVALGSALVEHGVDDGLRRYDRSRRRATQRFVTVSRVMLGLSMNTRFTTLSDAAIRTALRFA